jgi:hypothetical protein
MKVVIGAADERGFGRCGTSGKALLLEFCVQKAIDGSASGGGWRLHA